MYISKMLFLLIFFWMPTPLTAGGVTEETPASSARFVVNNNGTVTDVATGLVLLQNANCFDPMTWSDALDTVAFLGHGQCGLTDHSVSGQWRLPSKEELDLLLIAKNSPAFVGVQSAHYWSGTSSDCLPELAWYAPLAFGYVNGGDKTNTYRVWPVSGKNKSK